MVECAEMEETIAQQFASARRRAGEAVSKGRDGISVARELSSDVDTIVNAVAGPHLVKCPTPVAILATGGFGRRELAPYSDLDLLVLCADRPGRDVSVLAEAILYPLWDAKVDAGHAVRSFDQALALPASDLAAATALLDARFLIGDQGAGDPVPGRVPLARRRHRRRGLRGAPARRAARAPQPLRRHDLPARAGSEERPGRHARSVRGALGGDGALRHQRAARAAGQGRDERAARGRVPGRARVAAARAHRHPSRGGAPPGSAALRDARGGRADPVRRRQGQRGRHPARGRAGGRGADAPVSRPRQAGAPRDRAPAPARHAARRSPAHHGAGRAARLARARPQLRDPRRRARAGRRVGVREEAVGDDPHLLGGGRAGRSAGAAHARGHRRARRLERRGAARRPRDRAALHRFRLRHQRPRQPDAPRGDAGPRPPGGDHAGVGAVDRPRPARHLPRVHRRPARALCGGAPARALARRAARRVPGAERDHSRGAAPGGDGRGHAAPRRGQALRQAPQRQGRRPDRRHRAPAGAGGGGHSTRRVPGAPAPGDGADVAAARSRRPGHDRDLRRSCAATRRTCARCTCSPSAICRRSRPTT